MLKELIFLAWENIATLSSNELPDLSNASGVLFENPSCTGLSQVSSNGAIAPSNSTFTCTWENHTNFEVKYYSDEVLVKTFSTETYPGSSYVDTFSWLDDWDYVVTCTVDNEPLQDLCIDEFTLSKPLIPSISIEKTAIDGTENQTVNSGWRAEFKIVVKNTGDTDLAWPFTLTDPKVESGNCSGVVDLPSDITSTFENFDVYGVTGYDEDHLLQQGESFEYTCYEDDVEEETFDGFNTISVSAPTVDTVSDDTYIDVLPAPVCESLTLEATTRVVPFDSWRIVCTGNSEVSTDYTITISQNGDVVHTENEKETRYDFEEAGDYVVTCTLTNDLEVSSNTCELPLTTVADTEPAIGLVKTDYNEAIDSDSREDYQEIPSWSSAVFKITVSNDWDEALTDLELFDTTNISVDWREDHRDICGWTVNLTTKKLSSGLDIVYSWTGSNLEIWESFYYICTLDNTEEWYTNTAEVTANSVVDWAPVGAENPSHVLVWIYDLALVKTVDEASSTLQKDGTVVFDITVENQWSIDATNIVVTDYIPEGLTLAAGQPSWAVSGNEVTRNIGNIDAWTSAKTVSIIFDITAEEWTITNWAEITETGENLEDCDSPENNEGVMSTTGVVNDAIGSGCWDADWSDEDDHDYEEIIISKYDLALIKTVVDVKDEYLPGDSVTFNIEVTNQGQVDATNVVVTDYIPDGLEIVDPDNLWLVAQDNRVTRVVGDVTTSLPQSVQITFTVIGWTGDTITNIAEIYSDDGEDCDSFTDDEQNNSDDEMGTDFTNANTNPTGCNPDDGDEDDHDIAVINVGTTPWEYDLALVKTISDDTLDYEPGGSVTFEIEVINQGTESVSDIEITDYNPTGLTFSTLSWVNTGWTIDPTSGHSVYTIADTIAGWTSADIIEITFLIDEDATGTVYNYAEISEDNIDDCDSYADNEDGNTSWEETDNIIDNDVGDGCNPGWDEDDHDLAPVVISEEWEYDLALIKTLSDDTIEYNVWDPVTFDIEVINQWRGSVINVEIIDYIPDYLRLAPQENGVNTGWSKVWDNAVYTITDTITWNTSADIVQITFIIEEGATGTIYNTAEISEDNVEDCDSTADNEDGNTSWEETDNIIDNDVGWECEEGWDEDDHDIAPVVIWDDLKYDLALVKKVLNPTADYQSSDGVVFEIEVFNQWDIDATWIKVTDYVQDWLTFKDESWINTGWTYDEATDNASYTISETIASWDSKVIEITFTIDAWATDGEVLYNYAEISEDNWEDCDSTPDATNQSDAWEDADLDESAEWSQCQTTADEDDHDRADVVIGWEDVYDLALVKKVLNPSTDYQSWDDVTFEIEVFNQWDIDATWIKVTDYVQTGLRFKDESGTNTWWTYDDSTDNALYVISNTIASGDSETIEITFTIDAWMSDGDVLYNYAEISEDNWDDCDSTPDDTNQSDAWEDADLDESTEWSQCQTTADEDDHDRADVVIGWDISAIGRIKIEKYSNQGTLDQDGDKTKTVTDDSQLIDNWTSALFNIKITNTWDVDLINIEVTDIYDDTTCNLDSLSLAAWSAPHIYDCERDFTTDDYTNTVSVTAVNADTGEAIPVDADDSDVTYVKVPGPRVCVSGCGPGTPAICENIEEESLTRFTCSWNSKSKFIAIDCDGDWLYEENVHKREATLEWGIYSYTFTCNNLDVDNNIIELTPKCAVSDSSRPSVWIAHAGWSSRFQCTHTKDSEEICWNTKVEPDNGETCDVGAVSTTECYWTDAWVGKQCTAPGKDSCLDPDYALLNPLECGDCSNSVYYDANEAFCTIVTNPDERTLEITSISDFAIWEQNVFKHDVAKNRYGFNTPWQEENYLKVENTGEKAIYLNDRLCLVDMWNNLEPWTRNVWLNQNLISPTASVPWDINGWSSGVKTWCQSHVIGWIYPNYDDQWVEFDNSHYYRTSDIADIVWNPSWLDVDGNTSDTTRLVLTVKWWTAPFTSNWFDYPGDLNELYVWSPVLSGDIYVTVSNPWIESPVGWLSYIKDAWETSSISEIVAKVNNNGKTVITNTDQQNFVATVLGSGSNLSEVDTIDGC